MERSAQEKLSALRLTAWYATPEVPDRERFTVTCSGCLRLYRVLVCYVPLFREGCPSCNPVAFAAYPDLSKEPHASS